MFTSYLGNLKNIPAELRPVCIARGKPRFYAGDCDLRLAPTWAMLKMDKAEYDHHFNALLAQLDPAQVYRDLGENAVLLCWEKPNESCHRRRVAEWLEGALGVVIPELGLERSACLPYDAMPFARKAERSKAPPAAKRAKGRGERGSDLFGGLTV